MIEMHHVKRRMTYVQLLNLLIVQIENIERLRYLNITPDKILLTGTARCFDVKQAPCDAIVTADTVLDKGMDILYKCSDALKMPVLRISASRCLIGGYFSEINLQTILKMQKEKNEKHTLLAYNEDSVAFARICHDFQWECIIISIRFLADPSTILAIGFLISAGLALLMFERFKRFVGIRYVHILRAYLYRSKENPQSSTENE